jgi:hypothetical protein
MEPFLTRDGNFLFFNNSNDPKVDTNLFWASRIDDLTFSASGGNRRRQHDRPRCGRIEGLEQHLLLRLDAQLRNDRFDCLLGHL